MKVVIDTNVLLVCISPRSKAHWLWQAILLGRLDVYVTTDILTEYTEILTQRMNREVAEAALDLLTELENVHQIQKYYLWQLVDSDHDDDKFVDCAIAGGVNYLVSNDKHLRIIKEYPYFNIQLATLEEFEDLFEKTL